MSNMTVAVALGILALVFVAALLGIVIHAHQEFKRREQATYLALALLRKQEFEIIAREAARHAARAAGKGTDQ